MNPSPLSRLESDHAPTSSSTSSSTPVRPSQSINSPATPSQPSRASPMLRRPLGEKNTPRSSRLAQEVFSASVDADEDNGNDSPEGEDVEEAERMEVDDER